MRGLILKSTDGASPHFIGDKLATCQCNSFDYETRGDEIVIEIVFEHDEEAYFAADLCRDSGRFTAIDIVPAYSPDFVRDMMSQPAANLNRQILEI